MKIHWFRRQMQSTHRPSKLLYIISIIKIINPILVQIMSSLVRILACYLFGARLVSKSIVAYCFGALHNKFQWNMHQNTTIVIQGNITEKVVGKIAVVRMNTLLPSWGYVMNDTNPLLIVSDVYRRNPELCTPFAICSVLLWRHCNGQWIYSDDGVNK